MLLLWFVFVYWFYVLNFGYGLVLMMVNDTLSWLRFMLGLCSFVDGAGFDVRFQFMIFGTLFVSFWVGHSLFSWWFCAWLVIAVGFGGLDYCVDEWWIVWIAVGFVIIIVWCLAWMDVDGFTVVYVVWIFWFRLGCGVCLLFVVLCCWIWLLSFLVWLLVVVVYVGLLFV